MYKIIKNVINNKDYKLEDIIYKINKMYIEGRILEDEKSELENLARFNAKVENSYNIQEQLNEIFERLKKLEGISEETTEEYLEFIQPTGEHNSYNLEDKITYNGRKYICKSNNCVWSPEIYPDAWEEVI